MGSLCKDFVNLWEALDSHLTKCGPIHRRLLRTRLISGLVLYRLTNCRSDDHGEYSFVTYAGNNTFRIAQEAIDMQMVPGRTPVDS